MLSTTVERAPSWPERVLALAERMRPGSVLDPRCAVRRAFAFDRPPDLGLLAAALTAVAERHDAVRTVPRADGGRVRLAVRPPEPVPVPVGRLPVDATDADVHAAVLAAATAPFDLAAGPLLRAVWLPRGTGGVLVLALHHWAGDAAALDALQRETADLYAALGTGRDLPPPPPGYAAAAARPPAAPATEAAERAWWRAELAGLRRASLPVTGPGRTGGATRLLARPLDPAASAALLRLTAVHRASPAMVLLAALGGLLEDGREAGSRLDAGVFTVTGTRTGPARRAVGFLSEPLPLRLRLDRDAPLGAAVAAVRQTVLAATAHRAMPFLRLLEAEPRLAVALLRGRRPATLVQYFALPDLDLGGRRGRVLATFPAGAGDEAHPWVLPVDLDLTVERRADEHSAGVLFDPGLWDAAAVDAALDRLAGVLVHGLATPDRPLAALSGGGAP
ncbi:condensation domain-containing protein [Geodermatophilus sp. SYSU D00758]